MSNSKSHNTVRWLMESAIMIAIGTMLSEFPKIDFPLGGGLTICSQPQQKSDHDAQHQAQAGVLRFAPEHSGQADRRSCSPAW